MDSLGEKTQTEEYHRKQKEKKQIQLFSNV